MRSTSLVAHELLCLHLQSFYGSSLAPLPRKTSKVRALSKVAGKNFRRIGSFRFSKLG